MNRAVFITNVSRRHAMMAKAIKELSSRQELSLQCESILLNNDVKWGKDWEKLYLTSAVVIVKWMGTSVEDYSFLQKTKEFLQKHKINHAIFIAEEEVARLSSGFSADELHTLNSYILAGGLENFGNLWLWLGDILVKAESSAPAPQILPWAGIYHPRSNSVYSDIENYRRDFCQPQRLTIGILFYRDEWLWGDLAWQNALIEEIERQGLNAVCVFTNGMPDKKLGMPGLHEVFDKFFTHKDKPAIDVLINTLKFSLSIAGTMTVEYLQKFNIPLLKAYSLISEYKFWQENVEGMTPVEISIDITLPEFEGCIHALPVSSKKVYDDGDVEHLPINEMLPHLVNKAKKWAALRHKENKDKKVAIIFHNYPPKNSNIGSAAGLDSIESVRRLLAAMKEQGYNVTDIPEDGKSFIKELTYNSTNDRDYITERQIREAYKLSKEEYAQYHDTFTGKVKMQLEKDWGDAPGEVFAYDEKLLIPGTMKGNVFVTVQPPRGFGEDPAKIYHSPYCAPTHHYLAFYYWLREIWQADAVIHVGTHGSMEWLPGKTTGLSNECYPFLALGDLPDIYPYYITIVGEGMQAKRRGSACLIGHLTPPLALSGAYDEIEELEKLLDEYAHFLTTQPENIEKVKELIMQKVEQANIANEVKSKAEEDFQSFAEELHGHITDIKNMQMKTGLHILGQAPEGEYLEEFMLALTRMKNGDIPSLVQTIAADYGFDYYELLENSFNLTADGRTYGSLIDEIWAKDKQVIEIMQKNNFNSEKLCELMSLAWVKAMDKELLVDFLQVCRYMCTNIYNNLLLTKQEMSNTLRALNGEYIEHGPAGSPTSGGADILPTGRNFFGVDPRNLPTEVAWEIGKEMGEQIIARFIAEEGRYPESVGVVFWSGSNMRSHGQCLAEFYYLLGVKPVWQKASRRVIDLEVIPLAELKRPRIDVTARISGLFRDSMPIAIEWMDKAVQMVATLDEDTERNFIRKHILADVEELEAKGLGKDEAWKESAYRIFGCELGTYGAGVAALLEEKNWDDIHDIAKVYVRWGGHAYSKETRGDYLPEAFGKQMGRLDVTIKNENSRETNMLSSDDFNAFHGGMIATVRSIKGSAPRSYTSDSSDRSKIITRSVQEEMKRVFRGEAVNPKFIAGMMKHGYKGASDLSNYLAHSFQWDATSNVMEDWMYEKYAEKYAFDPKVQEWMKDVNPWALKRITETLLEAEQRGMWNAKDETKEKLQQLYLSVEGELEDISDE